MTLTTRQVAEEMGVEPKRLRYFLRQTGIAHTSEGRYRFDSRQVRKLKRQYATWKSNS